MILIDNTVLSNFALVDEMGILQAYCGNRGGVTSQVLTEFEQGVQQGVFRKIPFDWLQQVNLTGAEEILLFANLSKRLGEGEASCLAIAMQRKYDLLTDDMAVRKIALREGLRLSGSIGVLLELVRTADISLNTGNRILKAFIDQGYFAPVETLDEFL